MPKPKAITQAERDVWAGKKDTAVYPTREGWCATHTCLSFEAHTKNAAIDKAIRAERAQKPKRKSKANPYGIIL